MGRPAGPHLQRFAHLGRELRNRVYVVEYSTGLIKVGFSNSLQGRLRRLSMDCASRGESLTRYEVFVGHQDGGLRHDPQQNELRAIRALQEIAQPVAGTAETFDCIPFDKAVAVVASVFQA